MVDGDRGMERRSFLGTLAILGLPGAGLAWTSRAAAPTGVPRPTGAAGPRPVSGVDAPPPTPGFRHELERVQAVVGASHGNFERVRTLVDEQPALAKGSWDWGFGDWESALGAASHTGRREIAEYLIGHGARPTIFSAAMLGQVDIVRAFLEEEPALYRLHGPHGIPLMNHARAGGAEAERVVDYLLDRFGPEERPFGLPGTDEIDARYGGRYRFSEDPSIELVVGVRNDWLMVGAGEQPQSRVLEVAPDTFHPTGAPAVRLWFDVVEGRARSLTVTDGPTELVGPRTD
jgi:hypothetical protein